MIINTYSVGSLAVIESKLKETKVEKKARWEEMLEELSPLFETIFNFTIKPLAEVSSDQLEEKIRLLSPSFNYFGGIIQAKMFESSSPETIIQIEEEMFNSLEESVEKRTISEEEKTFLEDFRLGLAKLLEFDKFVINMPQVASREEFPIFFFYVLSLQYATAAGVALIQYSKTTTDVIAWLSERSKGYIEIIDAYFKAFNTKTREAYRRLRGLEEREKTLEDKFVRLDNPFSRPIPKEEAILWFYYFSNRALEETRESKYQGLSNALFRFGVTHEDVNAFMALKEEEPLVKKVRDELGLSEDDLPFLIISPVKLYIGKKSVPKERIHIIRKGIFTDKLCNYNNALDFFIGLYEAQKEEKPLGSFIWSEKFKTLVGVGWEQIKPFISLAKPF